jgi:4a-hydroxytetrahydrobiopterin dehydratase
MTSRLSVEERETLLPALGQSGWGAVPGRDAIRKIWKFRGFSPAWGFMCRAALLAEKMDHHPEWTNIFNVVDVTLTTHSAGGLSHLDIEMARKLDKLAPEAEIQTDHGLAITCLCGAPDHGEEG